MVFVSWLPSSDPSFSFVAIVKHGTPFHSTRFFLCLASTLMHLIRGGNDGQLTCRCWDAIGTFGWLEGHLDLFLFESCGRRSLVLRARAFRRHETVDANPLRSFPGILRRRSSYVPRIDLTVPRSPLGSTLARVHGPSRPTHRSSDPPPSVPNHHPLVSFFSNGEETLLGSLGSHREVPCRPDAFPRRHISHLRDGKGFLSVYSGFWNRALQRMDGLARCATSTTVQLAMPPAQARNVHVETLDADGFRWVRLKKIQWKDETDTERNWEAAERTTRAEGTTVDAVAAITYVVDGEKQDVGTINKRKRDVREEKDERGKNVSTKLELELPSPMENVGIDLNQEYREGDQPTPKTVEKETTQDMLQSKRKNARRMVLVSQFRPAVGKYVLELPAGLVDESDIQRNGPTEVQPNASVQDGPSEERIANETIDEAKLESACKKAAERELYEETGLHGTAHSVSPEVFSDPGLSNASVRFVRIDVESWGKQQQNSSESEQSRITTHFVSASQPLQDAHQIAKGGNMEIDARLYAFLAGIEEGSQMKDMDRLED